MLHLGSEELSAVRVLKTLSNCAFAVNVVIWLLDWYHWSWLDESVMNNPAASAAWLQRRHWYARIGLASVALFLVLRISYWIIEYQQDRRRVIANRGG